MKLLVVFNSDPVRAPFSFRGEDPSQHHLAINAGISKMTNQPGASDEIVRTGTARSEQRSQHSHLSYESVNNGIRSLSGLILSLTQALHHQVLSDVRLAVNPLQLLPHQLRDIEQLLDRCPFETHIIGSDEPSLTLENITNPYSWAKGQGLDAVLFVEADCLMPRHGVESLVTNAQYIHQVYHQDVILTPIDQPELYTTAVPSLLVTGSTAFWRSIPATRRSFLISRKVLELWAPTLAEDFTRRLWTAGEEDQMAAPLPSANVNCLSPMPGLGVSLLGATPPPFVPVSTWLEESSLGNDPHAYLRSAKTRELFAQP